MRRRLAHLDRTSRIVRAFVRHGLLGLVDQLGLVDHKLAEGHGDQKVVARFGRRLSMALNDLGPTFVKFGQILSTREDLFPEAVVRELCQLQDNAKPFPAREARAAVEAALGEPLVRVFAHFEDEPLAAGSIAQVHRARTIAGEIVAIKIRRPKIEHAIDDDLALLRALAEMASARSPEIARFDPVGLVEEFGRGLRAELNFEAEADALEEMRGSVGKTARIPKVFRSMCSRSVLALEFIEGNKVSALEPHEDSLRVARQVVGCFATQYLRGTLFHADPHGGNVLLGPDGRLALLDLGAVGGITKVMRRNVVRLSLAAARGKGDAMADAALEMVHAPPTLDRDSYRRDLGAVLEKALGQGLGQLNVAELTRHVFQVARDHNLRFRTEYFLLMRSALLVDGLLRRLDPNIDPVAATRSHILRHFYSPRWFVPATWLALGLVLRTPFRLLRRLRGPRVLQLKER